MEHHFIQNNHSKTVRVHALYQTMVMLAEVSSLSQTGSADNPSFPRVNVLYGTGILLPMQQYEQSSVRENWQTYKQ